ncbi:MAG: hypothetical protein ACTSR0_07690 [Candidatus Asgardarchaeia archaeon]
MRKILVTLLILFIIVVSIQLFSKNSQLMAKASPALSELGKNLRTLINIQKALQEIAHEGKKFEERALILFSVQYMKQIGLIYSYEVELLRNYKFLKEENKGLFYNEAKKRLEVVRKDRRDYIDQIEAVYTGIKNKKALSLIDKAKNIINLSFGLLTKSLEKAANTK